MYVCICISLFVHVSAMPTISPSRSLSLSVPCFARPCLSTSPRLPYRMFQLLSRSPVSKHSLVPKNVPSSHTAQPTSHRTLPSCLLKPVFTCLQIKAYHAALLVSSTRSSLRLHFAILRWLVRAWNGSAPLESVIATSLAYRHASSRLGANC